ncbi:hypothetical protein BGZ76_007303 [Entomortierella beljakovae]|nr:hypothetical protein BGZ76_007303 [Entomortierella beljakovae]
MTLSRYNRCPERSSVSSHANLVVSLNVSGASLDRVNDIQFPHLRDLTLCYSSEFQETCPWKSAMFMSKHLSVEKLRLDRFCMADDYEFWDNVSRIQNLRILELSGIDIDKSVAEMFWKAVCSTETANIEYVELPNNLYSQEILSTSSPIKLTNLSFTSPQHLSDRLQFIEQFPMLESLEYNIYSFESIAEGIRDRLSQGIWPNLCKLIIPSRILDDQIMEQILGNIKTLKVLKCLRTTWTSNTFTALSYHFGSLEELGLGHDHSLTSTMVNTIMCSCANLTVLSVPESVIRGLDIIGSNQTNDGGLGEQEWVCSKLNHLELQFNLDGMVSQIPIISRISKLSQLGKLRMKSNMNAQDNTFQHLSFSLNDGLANLSSLKRLNFLAFGMDQEMTNKEAEWIVKNWKNLEYIQGKLNSDVAQCDNIKNILESNDITIKK